MKNVSGNPLIYIPPSLCRFRRTVPHAVAAYDWYGELTEIVDNENRTSYILHLTSYALHLTSYILHLAASLDCARSNEKLWWLAGCLADRLVAWLTTP